MNKPSRKVVNITAIHVDFNVNVRERDNYDLPNMKEQILATDGRIQKPIIVRGEDMVVLSGNRRTLAGQELFADPNVPAIVKDNLSKVDVIVYTGLTPLEETQLIFDHGGEKPISRVEVLKSVWRLYAQGFKESEIIRQMYFVLANYTGKSKKLSEVPGLDKPTERQKFLNGWFHGTIGNYMLMAYQLGQYVQEQMILTHKSEDGTLKDDEKIEIRMSRERIKLLSAARTQDEKSDEGWNSENGGAEFNRLLQQFRDEDAGRAEKQSSPKALSAGEIKKRADGLKATALKKAFLACAGEQQTDLPDLDDEVFRLTKVNDVLKKVADKLPNGQVTCNLQEILNLIAVSGPKQLESYFNKENFVPTVNLNHQVQAKVATAS